MKHIKQLFTILLCSIILVACNNGPQSDVNSQSDSENRPQLQLYNKTFEQMANYDNYIIGTTIEGKKTDNPAESYILFEADGQEYRLEGLYWNHYVTQQPFVIDDECYINLRDTVGAGGSILVFYDEEDVDGNVIRPKSYDIFYKEWDLEKTAKRIQRRAERLMDNYNAISEPKISNPQDALLAVIEAENLGPAEIGTNIYGAPCYVCGDKYVFLGEVRFNEEFGMTDEEIVRYYQEAHSIYPHFLKNYEKDHFVDSAPYIQYCVWVEKDERIYNELSDTYYWKDESSCYWVGSDGNIEKSDRIARTD